MPLKRHPVTEFTIPVSSGNAMLFVKVDGQKVRVINHLESDDFGFVQSINNLEDGKMELWKDVAECLKQSVALIEELLAGEISLITEKK